LQAESSARGFGHKRKAIDHCETFLSFWNDIDPSFPEIEKAKEKWLTLKGLDNRIQRGQTVSLSSALSSE